MTILEVMFAIMITTIGLLGAIAVFPVASEYARKGRLNDEVTVCAESAVHTMDARGMRRPERWITHRFISGSWQQIDYYTPTPNNIIQPGLSYCLDPRFVAANLIVNGSPPPTLRPNYIESTWFPAFPHRPGANAGPVSGPNDPDSGGNPFAPRMQRITLAYGVPSTVSPYLPFPYPMGRFQADYVFSFEDQLSYERPGVQKGAVARNDNALPAFQLYSPIRTSSGILPGKREEDGKLSWIATLVPKIDRWNATLEDKYVLSIVVFYNRGPSTSLMIADPSVNPPALPFKEWTAIILGSEFHSSGYGGGEVTITADDPSKLQMRAGDWVMLSGHVMARIPSSGEATTVPTYKWYKVTDADEDPRLAAAGIWKRDVTLVGPDWDLQDVLPFSGGVPDPDGEPDDVEVTIVPGIVAVFDRTVRLEVDGTGF